ncbi:hypothetical protein BDK51DRAFT_50459 [Blyttiomyces helicus]|uniref:Uncharacterized protein n=1 Tax=Blyttiomyces helicus TaxID=388810 RepID=A0A4P9WEL6_9FUNG|nr:hypothetical protein BDK51DRAFT_50459 [Blyttiomyces helicus]|eukprot:RKO91169.1 hypothetical protein BDK51DRAFT_50459 [Blyttiomyces helicus]
MPDPNLPVPCPLHASEGMSNNTSPSQPGCLTLTSNDHQNEQERRQVDEVGKPGTGAVTSRAWPMQTSDSHHALAFPPHRTSPRNGVQVGRAAGQHQSVRALVPCWASREDIGSRHRNSRIKDDQVWARGEEGRDDDRRHTMGRHIQGEFVGPLPNDYRSQSREVGNETSEVLGNTPPVFEAELDDADERGALRAGDAHAGTCHELPEPGPRTNHDVSPDALGGRGLPVAADERSGGEVGTAVARVLPVPSPAAVTGGAAGPLGVGQEVEDISEKLRGEVRERFWELTRDGLWRLGARSGGLGG